MVSVCRLCQAAAPVLCFYAPAPIGESIKRCFSLTSACLSVAYIGPKSRTERPRNTKIGPEVAHITHDSGHHFQGQKVKVTRPLYSPPCRRVRQLQRWAWERVGREKLLLRCHLLSCARRFGTHGGRRGAGHIVAAARLQLVLFQSPQTVFHSAG